MTGAAAGRPPTGSLKVAAIGWGNESGAPRAEALVAEAARRGAKLALFPEAAFELLPGGRAAFERQWSYVARKYGLFIVVPYLDRELLGSRLLVFTRSAQRSVTTLSATSSR